MPICSIPRPLSHFLYDEGWGLTPSGIWESGGKLTLEEFAKGPGKERSLYLSQASVCILKKGVFQHIHSKYKYAPMFIQSCLNIYSGLKTFDWKGLLSNFKSYLVS